MNKHIELVKKWLADPDSVTQEELEKNMADAADAVSYADSADAAAYGAVAYAAAAYAAGAVVDAADAVYWVTKATHWVEQYEALEKKS